VERERRGRMRGRKGGRETKVKEGKKGAEIEEKLGSKGGVPGPIPS
jgi:hypothetical protein